MRCLPTARVPVTAGMSLICTTDAIQRIEVRQCRLIKSPWRSSSEESRHSAARARPLDKPHQCDDTQICFPGSPGIANLAFRRATSSPGLRPKSRLNSRLNCEALS
jgi:hypothetical protein